MTRSPEQVKKELVEDTLAATEDPNIYHADAEMPSSFYMDMLDKAERENLGLDDNVVFPSAGMVLIYNIARYTRNGRSALTKDQIRRSMRVDGYRWSSGCGTRKVGDKERQAYRSYNCVYNPSDARKLDTRFKRKEYWYEDGQTVVLHYIGNDELAREVAETTPHGNSKKKTGAYVRTNPIVFAEAKQALESGQRLDEAFHSSVSKGRDMLRTARSMKQLAAVKERLEREKKRKAATFYNIHTLHELLRFEGTRLPFVVEMEMIRVIGFLFCEPLIEEFINTANLSAEAGNRQTHVLFYQTGYSACGALINILSFRHSVFEDDPPVPMAFLIAEKYRPSDDVHLLEKLVESFPRLREISICIASSLPLSLSHFWPQARFIQPWNDFKYNMKKELTVRMRTDADTVKKVVDTFEEMSTIEKEKDFQQKMEEVKEELDAEGKELWEKWTEEWKEYCAPWLLNQYGVEWKETAGVNRINIGFFEYIIAAAHEAKVSVDGLIGSLFYVCQHMINEMERGYYQLGQLCIKPAWASLTDDPSQLPSQPFAPYPEEIIPFIITVALNSQMSVGKKRKLLSQQD